MLTALLPLDSVGEEAQDEDNLAVKKACLYKFQRNSHNHCRTGSRIGPIFPQLTSHSDEVSFMVVKTQNNGREVLGLRVGAANARRYFPRSMGAVELLLGDLRIQCKLTPAFWKGQPEIHDPRLGAWLTHKVSRERFNLKPIPLAMEHAGGNAFSLQSVSFATKRGARMAASM